MSSPERPRSKVTRAKQRWRLESLEILSGRFFCFGRLKSKSNNNSTKKVFCSCKNGRRWLNYKVLQETISTQLSAMSFGGKSFKREKLRLRKELQELTKQSKNEFAILNTSDKSKLLESSSKTSLVQRAHPGHTRPAKKGTKIRQTAVTDTKITSNSDEEIPPPSPSIDLEAEIRKTPDVDAKTFQRDNQDLHRSTTAERKNSSLISRSTGVASIRSRKDLNVVMYGKGLGDESSIGVKPKVINSYIKKQSRF